MKLDATNRQEELRWIASVRQGDHQAFEKLFRCYYFPLTRFAWRYVESKAVAEELVQEIFSEIWEDRAKLNITESVRSYLYKAVKHRSLNYLKHQRVRLKYDTQWIGKREDILTIEYIDQVRVEQIKEAIKEAIDELPPRSRMTYKLHRYDGLTYSEIAEVMEISVKTVESQMTRTLKMLRERLSYLLPFLLVALRIAG